jgi:heme-degrading monooxygenase HmoA
VTAPVYEVAQLPVRPGREADFEQTFAKARDLISATPGFLGLELRRCAENDSRYLLLVSWASVEAHTVGFRQGPNYAEWSALLHPFYDPFPVVEHYLPTEL